MTVGVGYERLATRLQESGVPFFSLQMRRGVPSAAATARLVSLVRQLRPQIMQTWMYHADLLGTVVSRIAPVQFLAWNLRCSALTINDQRRRSKLLVRLLARLSRLPHVVLANSQAGIDYHRSIGYSPKKWAYIPNSLDTSAFRQDSDARAWLRADLKLDSTSQLVGLIGRFHPAKDHTTFVNAAKILATRRPLVHFILAGTSISQDNEQLMELIRSTGFQERFHLMGHRTDVPRITAALDLACSSSISEGSSNVIAEAMACGVPCVVTDVGDSSVVVAEWGRVVPPRNPSAFAQACAEMLDLPDRQRVVLAAAARSRAEACFSLPSVVDQYERLYNDLHVLYEHARHPAPLGS